MRRLEKEIRDRIVSIGTKNHQAYLASDHLDVYVATSMRQRHEYTLVNQATEQIFKDSQLRDLNLRWFDPTQAYCPDRIDKGLAEALMLKRAKCTVYFVQENDTFGKDSELASTLAQGKIVIAYIPEVPDPPEAFLENLLTTLRATYPERNDRELVLNQLQLLTPEAAWVDETVRAWLESKDNFDLARAKGWLAGAIKKRYDKRARDLREKHPLGIQVNLDTGVANGVLVVRRIPECAALIRRAVTRTLEFDLETRLQAGRRYLFLRERISNCIFRVMTGDPMLTNSFWNYYLSPDPDVEYDDVQRSVDDIEEARDRDAHR